MKYDNDNYKVTVTIVRFCALVKLNNVT